MKFALMAILLMNVAFGSDKQEIQKLSFSCQSSYDAKINKLAGKTVKRSFWTFTTGTGAVAYSAGSLLLTGGFSAIPLLGAGALGLLTVDSAKQFISYVDAELAIVESIIGREKAAIIVEENLKKETSDLLVKRVNPKRRKKGLREYTLEEYLVENPLKVETPIEKLVYRLEQKNGIVKDYDEVSAQIRNEANSKTFCKNGKPMGLKKLRKWIVKEHDMAIVRGDQSGRLPGKDLESFEAQNELSSSVLKK
jgi:hypothetical protein